MKFFIVIFLNLLMINSHAIAETAQQSNPPQKESNDYFYKKSNLKYALYFAMNNHLEVSSRPRKDGWDRWTYMGDLFPRDHELEPKELVNKYCSEFFSLPSAKPSVEKELAKHCKRWGWLPTDSPIPQR